MLSVNARFRRRFAYVEEHGGIGSSLPEMEELWQKAKVVESQRAVQDQIS